MSTERFSLEEINNMDLYTARQILKNQELERIRADRQAEQAAAEAAAKKAEEEKFMDDYFKERFANQHPKFHDQF